MQVTCKERILSNDYLDLITDYRLPAEYNYDLPMDSCYQQVEGELGILYVEREKSEQLGSIRDNYYFLPKCYGLMQEENVLGTFQTASNNNNDIPYLESGITTVQNAPLRLTGKQVVIGFIDTGIQYQNEAFLDTFGGSRILAIWDQTIQTGTPPEGFDYGSEYTKEQIDEALRSDTPLDIVPSTDENGHGTAIASVAAGGSGRINSNMTPLGAAPNCDIAVVKLKEAKEYYRNYYFISENTPCYQENDIILAIKYLQKFARVLLRPLVICLGIGTNLGDHTGNGTLSGYINYLSSLRNRAFIIPAGNEGNNSHHYHGSLSDRNQEDQVEVRVGQDCEGFVMDFFGDLPYQFNISVRSPAGEVVRLLRVSEESRARNQRINYTFLFEATKLYADYYTIAPYSESQLIRIRMEAPAPGIWTFFVSRDTNATDTSFDIWLPISEFLSSEVIFLRPDPDTTITTPGYIQSAITVGAYQVGNNSIWQDSGRGFGRDTIIKPDIAAPGVQISTALGKRTGTSMAVAITAGAVAQLFQWLVVEENERLADANLVKSLLIRGAIRDRNLNYPNTQWGYGRLNIANVFSFLAGIS